VRLSGWGLAFLALVLAVSFSCGSSSGTAYCDSVDPTEASFAVTLVDDTAEAITVQQCDVSCSQTHETDKLVPGGRVKVNTSACGVDNWWMLKTADNGLIGCLNLYYTRKEPDVVVPVSRTVPCPVR
jgi:hypothetical protein